MFNNVDKKYIKTFVPINIVSGIADNNTNEKRNIIKIINENILES